MSPSLVLLCLKTVQKAVSYTLSEKFVCIAKVEQCSELGVGYVHHHNISYHTGLKID